jgi:hypothetical protein
MKSKITIPEPCHEDWNKMTPTAKGAFCTSCSKEVKDFTKSTDLEILKTIEKSDRQICGHISNNQLNRPLNSNQSNLRKWIIPFAASFSALAITNGLNAQNEELIMGEVEYVKTGKMMATHFKPVDSIPVSECNITKGDMTLETVKPTVNQETEIMVDGMLILQPFPEVQKKDTLIKNEITPQKTNTVRFDSIPFKSILNSDTTVEKNKIPKAKVFPNPISTWTTIQVEEEGLYNVSIFNNSGRIILKKSFFGTSLKVNLSTQANGIYFITLINGEGIKSKSIKLIKN